jgi:hypothetical protein
METKEQKYQVGFLINGDLFETVVTAKSEAEAFCLGRNKGEKYYQQNGVNLTSCEPITHPQSYVKPYIEKTIDWNNPIFDII